MAPTVLEALGIEAPEVIRGVTQSPIEGVSFTHTLDDPSAESDHHTQYFEMLGHRALYHDGWRAVCPWPGPSFTEAGVVFGAADRLGHVDRSSTRPVGSYTTWTRTSPRTTTSPDNRERLIDMIATWYVEAGKYDVLPVDGSGIARVLVEKPMLAPARDSYVFFPGTQSVPFFAGPRVLNRPHSITAEVEVPNEGGRGGPAVPGIGGGRLHLLRQGQRHALRPQLPGQGHLPRGRRRSGPAGEARPALRVRAHRGTGLHGREGGRRAACSSISMAPSSATPMRR